MTYFLKIAAFAIALRLAVLGLVLVAAPTQPNAQGAMLPLTVYKQMYQGNIRPGLVQFRNFNGSQWLYFTALQTMRCRIKEVRVSFNSVNLDQRMVLLPCNPQNPFAMPSDVKVEQLALKVPPGVLEYAAIQVVWEDDTVERDLLYKPCDNAGEQSCAALLN